MQGGDSTALAGYQAEMQTCDQVHNINFFPAIIILVPLKSFLMWNT